MTHYRDTIRTASTLGKFGVSDNQIAAFFAPLDSIASAEGPNTAWLRANSGAIDQIRRDRLADEARVNGGQSNG